jgi:hypothetical protein
VEPPLHGAINGGFVGAVHLLLAKGADIEARDSVSMSINSLLDLLDCNDRLGCLPKFYRLEWSNGALHRCREREHRDIQGAAGEGRKDQWQIPGRYAALCSLSMQCRDGAFDTHDCTQWRRYTFCIYFDCNSTDGHFCMLPLTAVIRLLLKSC